MITVTPLPSWRHLVAPKPGDAAVFSRWWLGDGEQAYWLSRTAWSLAAIADSWHAAHGRPPLVAVPDFICSAALGPLGKRAKLVFYPLGDDLTAREWPQTEILLLVHYFGRPSVLPREARERAALVVEDAAHVLAPNPGIGEFGDAVVYSPHKMLAAPDGGVLVVRRGGAAVIGTHLAAAIRKLGCTPASPMSWRLKRAIQKTALGAPLQRLRPGGQVRFSDDPAPHELEQTPVLSTFAAAQIAAANLTEVADSRRRNAAALADAISPLAHWAPLFPDFSDHVPYRLVMRCDTPAEADRVYSRLRAAHLPVESWPDLPAGVPMDSAARRLRGTLLLLPCHQSLRPRHLSEAYALALRAS